MTANAFNEDRDIALEAGMDGFLSKPIDVEELIRTLQRVFSGAPESVGLRGSVLHRDASDCRQKAILPRRRGE